MMISIITDLNYYPFFEYFRFLFIMNSRSRKYSWLFIWFGFSAGSVEIGLHYVHNRRWVVGGGCSMKRSVLFFFPPNLLSYLQFYILYNFYYCKFFFVFVLCCFFECFYFFSWNEYQCDSFPSECRHFFSNFLQNADIALQNTFPTSTSMIFQLGFFL